MSLLEEAEGLLYERRLWEAVGVFHRAEAAGEAADRCCAGRWMAAALGGDLEKAWCESDAIRARGATDPDRFWMGEDVRGRRVMVRCLHGLGDAIQFLRFLPRLRLLAKEVVVEVPPKLLPLAPYLEGMGAVVTWGEGAPERAPVWEVQVEVTELAYLLRVREGELPVAERYLRLPEAFVTDIGRRMGARRGLRMGLVWAAGEWNRSRSVSLAALEKMVRSGCAEVWSLQGGEARAEGEAWVRAGWMRDAAECGDGLCALAGVIANLDVVITVDTLAAHMAGAMGVPAWVMLERAADWRWMTGRCDSPWYPGMRLFRQTRDGDWAGVVERVQAELLACGKR